MNSDRTDPGKRNALKFLMMSANAAIDVRLSASTLRVYAVLCRFRDRETWEAYPSTRLLAQLLSTSQRAIQKHLAKIVELGYAKVVGHTPGGVRIFKIPWETD
jgi:helix-turn-helix protein